MEKKVFQQKTLPVYSREEPVRIEGLLLRRCHAYGTFFAGFVKEFSVRVEIYNIKSYPWLVRRYQHCFIDH